MSEAITTSEVQDTESGSREEPKVEPGQKDSVMIEQEHQKNVSEQVKGLNSNFVEQLLPVEVREQQLNDPELYPVVCFLEKGAQPSEAQLQALILNTKHLRLCRSQLEMVKMYYTISGRMSMVSRNVWLSQRKWGNRFYGVSWPQDKWASGQRQDFNQDQTSILPVWHKVWCAHTFEHVCRM